MAKQLSLKQLLPFFFLSGIAGLMYELSWIRQSSLIFGSTLPAVSTVTAIYFAGMAIGSWWLSRKGVKYSSKLYGKIQLGIAISSLFTLLLFPLFESITVSVYPLVFENSLLLTLYRFVAVAVVIAIPTFFLGATFPVMMALTPSAEGKEGFVVGVVNGVNAFGAVLGTVVTAFITMPFLGMDGTIAIAVGINLVVSLYFFSKNVHSETVVEEAASRMHWFPALPLFFVLGFAGMSSQVLWSRFLSLIIHNTVYTYAITIAVVITGIAVGSIIAGFLTRKDRNASRLLGTVVFLQAFFLALVLLLPSSFWGTIGGIPNDILRIVLISALMFIPALFGGASFPLALKMIGGGSEIRGRNSGILSAVNTVGGILGSLLSGFVLLPLLGVGGLIYVVIALLWIVGFVAFIKTKNVGLAWATTVLPLIVVALLFKSPRAFIYSYLKSPIEQNIQFDTRTNKFTKLAENIIYLKEGALSSVVVKQKGENFNTMEIDRLWQGENRKTRQIMAAHLPMLLADSAKNVAVIGVGPGITAKRFTMYGIDSLDLIDIESAVFDAAQKHFDGNWMKRDGIRTLATDGLNFMKYSDKEYDVISVEIGQVFRPHAAGFYSQEFYESLRNRLTQKGIVGQFVPVASFDPESFKRVIATFLKVFPESQLWYNRSEFILLGFKDSEHGFTEKKLARWLHPGTEVYDDLTYNYWGGSAYRLNSVNNLAAGFLCNSKSLKELVGKSKPYRDAIPELEYTAAKNQNNPPFVEKLRPFLSDFSEIVTSPSLSSLRHMKDVREANLDNIVAEELMMAYQKTGVKALLEEAYNRNPNNIRANRYLGTIAYENRDFQKAERHLARIYEQDFDSRGAGRQVALLRMQQGDLNGAIDLLVDVLKRDDKDAGTHALLGAALIQKNRFDMARQHSEWALQLEPENPLAVKNLKYLQSMQLGE